MRYLAWVAITLLISSCAGTSVRHFSAEPVGPLDLAKDKDRGLRFYESAPYILVFFDGENYSGQVVHLPVTTTVFSATPYAILSANNTDLEFHDGVFSKATVVVDTTKLVQKAIDLANDLPLGFFDDKPASMHVFLFRVGVDPTTGGPVLYRAAQPVSNS